MKAIMALAVVSALGACGTVQSNYAYHDSIKGQLMGVNMAPTTGFNAGYFGFTVDRVANVDKNGNAIVAQDCTGKATTVATYANMNSNSKASSNSVATAGVASPSVSSATGDVTANGGPAIEAAAMQSAHPADTVAAYCNNGALPNAPAGTIVRDGTSPKQ